MLNVDLLNMPPDPSSSGEPVVVFYDCEFTDLTSDAELLSVGLVDSVAQQLEKMIPKSLGNRNRPETRPNSETA